MYLSSAASVWRLPQRVATIIRPHLPHQSHCSGSDDASRRPPLPPSPASTAHSPKDATQPRAAKPLVVPTENPIARTLRLLGEDARRIRNFVLPPSATKGASGSEAEEPTIRELADRHGKDAEFQSHCDVLIIGGGGVGASIAYWLKKRAFAGLNVVVLEKDPTYQTASTTLSVGGLRQQFSLEENILMSLYGADFMRNVHEHLDTDCHLNFTPHGYLMLATEESAATLQANSDLQRSLGAKNETLTARRLKAKFPWLNTEGIALGCHGLEKEGWFDPWALLMGFKRTASRLGAHFIEGEAVGFEYRAQQDIFMEGIEEGSYEGLDKVQVRLPSGELKTIKFAQCIIAAGAKSGEVARMARIGEGPGMLSIALPVEPRKRYVYVVESQGANYPGLNTPLTVDPSNVYFRRDGLGGNFLCGRSPTAEQEPSCSTLDVDHEYFEQEIWPTLAARVPAFESLRVKSSWAGFYEYNTFDENGIIGSHPYYNNLYIATGFSGHGIQQTPAVGRAIAELIINGEFRTVDLSRLGFDRIIVDEPMFEVNIV